MKAIVTGGEGFIGARLVERLLAAGWDICIVDDYSTHQDPDYYNPKTHGVPLVQGTVQCAVLPTRFRDPDYIFHLAGKLGPVGVIGFKGKIAKDTIDAAYTVGQWALEAECPLIDVSTSEVYGSPDKANSEDTFKVFRGFTARSEYAISKLAAENMLINTDGLDVRIVRPFNVTGAGQRPEGGFVIPRFIRQALDGVDLTVYTPGTQRRSFTHVDDIIDGMIDVAYKGKYKEVYNLGNADNTRTMLQIAQLVIDVVGKGNIEVVDPRALHGPDFHEAPEKIPNAEKAIRELGFNPYRPIEQIVQEAYEDILKHDKSTSLRVPDTEQA